MKKTILMLGSILATGSLFAQWQKIDDLESYTVGDEVDADHSTTATGDWNMYRSADDQYATLPFFGIAADPGDGSQGNVLELNPGTPTEAGQGNTTLERAVPDAAQIKDPFPATTKSTFYMKYFRPIVDGSPAESDTTWGMVAESARNTETGIHAYGSYSVLGRTEIDGIIDIRDGGDYLDLTTAALETETWYEFWFVVDHANNMFTQYIKGGTDFPTQTQLPVDAAITAEYRNQTLDPLETILLITTTGGADNRKGKDSIYVDDFYIDVAGENLNSPGAPEPMWQKIDDLESYTVGDEVDADHSTTATGDWNMYRSADDQYATLPFFGIAADPGDGSQGNVLELNPGVPTEAGQGNTTLERAVPAAAQIVDPFPATTKSTFYMKYFRPIVDGSPAESDTTWGMVAESARNTETGIHAYGSYSVLGRTEIDGIIDIRDGGDYLDLTTAALETETWYEFWFVVDHANNMFTQYIKGGTDFPTQTQLPVDAAITAEYRNQTLDPLETILLITTTGGADNRKGKDSIYVDDFYIDVAGENLSSPVVSNWQKIDDLESYTVGDEVDADHSTTATGDWNMYRSADDQYATLPFFGIAADPGDGSQGNVLELNPGVPTEAGQGNTTLERAVPAAAQIVDPFPATTKSTFYMKYFRPIVDGSPAESDTTWGMVAESARNTETGIHAYGS